MALSQMLVQKLGVLPHIGPLLNSPKPSLQKAAMSLLSNVSSNTTSKEKHRVLRLHISFAGNSVKLFPVHFICVFRSKADAT